MNPTLKKFLPHIIAFVVLLVFSFLRFAPVVFQGKTLQQSDNIQARGMAAEMKKIKEETGTYPLWTNGPFAGMPGYQIQFPYKNAIPVVSKAFRLGNNMAPPHTGILLMCAGMYLLLVVMGVDWRLSIVGALGFGLAANHMGLAEAGHSTKIIASAYMAPVLAGLVLTFRGKYWLGAGFTALFTALQIHANHVQMTYYFFITLLIFGIVYLVDAVRKGTLPNFLKAAAFSAVAVGLAVATNAGRLLTTQEYAEETIRGTSELTQKSNQYGSKAGEDGLSKEYAFGWSYGVLETYNLLIPRFVGGGAESFVNDRESATFKAATSMNPAELKEWADANGRGGQDQNAQLQALAQKLTHYWGPQPFTGGGVYMGAVIFLLFFMGMFLVKSPIRWYVAASVVLTIMLAWGKHFPQFNFFMFDNFPMFNKFRAVTMVLGVTNMLVVLLAILGLQRFFDKNVSLAEKKKALMFGGAITAGLVLIGLLLSFGMDYEKISWSVDEADNLVKRGEGLPASVAAAIAEDRAGLLQADALRSLLFIALAFGLLWVWMKNKFAGIWAVVGIGLLVLIDMWTIGNRFIGSEDYVSKSQLESISKPSPANVQINADDDLHFRVADFQRGLPFANALTSYHHKSMGGYHAAKMMRYQEMIDKYLSNPGNDKIYGMFNCKYFIGQDGRVFPNLEALGNAWFVKSILDAPSGDAEIAALATIDPAEQVVIQEKYLGDLKGFSPQFDSTALITLTKYHPDEMVYQYSAKTDQLAVFSEMYYPPSKGWEMWIDGERAPDFTKADFTLRAARLPAGQHELKMVFNPKTYHTGENVALVCSILVLALTAFGIYWFSKNYAWPEPANLPEAEVKTKPSAARKTKAKRRKK